MLPNSGSHQNKSGVARVQRVCGSKEVTLGTG